VEGSREKGKRRRGVAQLDLLLFLAPGKKGKRRKKVAGERKGGRRRPGNLLFF